MDINNKKINEFNQWYQNAKSGDSLYINDVNRETRIFLRNKHEDVKNLKIRSEYEPTNYLIQCYDAYSKFGCKKWFKIYDNCKSTYDPKTCGNIDSKFIFNTLPGDSNTICPYCDHIIAFCNEIDYLPDNIKPIDFKPTGNVMILKGPTFTYVKQRKFTSFRVKYKKRLNFHEI